MRLPLPLHLLSPLQVLAIILAALDRDLVYPWRALAAFAPEKVVNDLVKSVLGAVYIDTDGNLWPARRCCDGLGFCDG